MTDRNSYINERLDYYLNNSNYDSYIHLIKSVKEGDDLKAKYNLYLLLMSLQTERLHSENLEKRLSNIYCDDKNIEEYLNKIIDFNPKLGYVSIQASHGMDMKNDHSLYLTLKVESNSDINIYFDNAHQIIKKAKEVLRIILMESKSVCP